MKKVLKFLIPTMISLTTLISCETLTGSIEIGREAPKDNTIIYVQADSSEVFGSGTAEALAQIITAHGIQSIIVPDLSSIPSYERELYSGTCFSIAPNYVITNSHVINYGIYDVINIYINGTDYQAEIVSNDKDSDLAVLYVPDYTFPYSFDLNLSPEYKLAEPVYTIGYPIADILNLDPRVTQGIINAKSGFDGNPDEIQISAELQPGNSGGPLLSTSDISKVIGVNSSTISDIASLAAKGTVMQNVNFSIKTTTIARIFPTISEIDLLPNTYPENLDQATEATAYVLTEYTPISPYSKRLVISSNTNTTETLHITSYGSWYSYETLLNMKFFDVDSGFLDSWIIDYYSGNNMQNILIEGFEDYCFTVYGDEKIF